MYTLHGDPFTSAIIVEMVFAEGDVPYELKIVDTIGQELKFEFLTRGACEYVEMQSRGQA